MRRPARKALPSAYLLACFRGALRAAGAPLLAPRGYWKRGKRYRWWVIAAAAAALGGAVLQVWLASTIQYRRALQKEGFVGEMPMPGSWDRILIVAPHPDDEVIGCGGLIQRALANGARVDVVLMTNGDGSELSLLFGEGELPLRPSAFVKLGRQRQDESTRALEGLGLTPRHVEFLGYPNNGILDMWQFEHWSPDRPYLSRNTNAFRSPYENSVTPGAIYCGQQALADLARVMLEVRPTILFVTHPNDVHPDHWSTDAFARYALATLVARGVDWAQQTRVYGYLVHWPTYPAPRRFLPRLGLLPPPDLLRTGAGWQKLPLTPDEAKRKLRAIRQYHSQLPNLDRLLLAFVRSNEMFAEVSPVALKMGEAHWLDEASPLHRLGGADVTGVRLHLDETGSAEAEITTRPSKIPGGGEVALDLRGWDDRGTPVGSAVYIENNRTQCVQMDASTRLHPSPATVGQRQPGRIPISRLPWPGGAGQRTAFVTCWGQARRHMTDPAVVQVVEREATPPER